MLDDRTVVKRRRFGTAQVVRFLDRRDEHKRRLLARAEVRLAQLVPVIHELAVHAGSCDGSVLFGPYLWDSGAGDLEVSLRLRRPRDPP